MSSLSVGNNNDFRIACMYALYITYKMHKSSKRISLSFSLQCYYLRFPCNEPRRDETSGTNESISIALLILPPNKHFANHRTDACVYACNRALWDSDIYILSICVRRAFNHMDNAAVAQCTLSKPTRSGVESRVLGAVECFHAIGRTRGVKERRHCTHVRA